MGLHLLLSTPSCPLAPYLFLIVAEVLNNMVKKGMKGGLVKGVSLPIEDRQQIIAQFAHDTSFTLHGKEEHVKNLLQISKLFCCSSRLVVNWLKSCGYWQAEYPWPP